MIREDYHWDRAPIVGERIEVCDSNQTPVGTRGVVLIINGTFQVGKYSSCRVRFDDGDERSHMAVRRFRPIQQPIDLLKVKHTRSGLPVANIEKSDDPARPITAEVFVGRNWLTLTYQNDGRFVSRFDQPVDLVEAQ